MMKKPMNGFLIGFLIIFLLVTPITANAVNTSVTSIIQNEHANNEDMGAFYLMDDTYGCGVIPKNPIHAGSNNIWMDDWVNSSIFLMYQQRYAPMLVYYGGGIIRYTSNSKPVESLCLMNKDWSGGYDWFSMGAAPYDYKKYINVMGRDIGNMYYDPGDMNYSAAPFTTVIINERVLPPGEPVSSSEFLQWRLWMYNMDAWAFFGNAENSWSLVRDIYAISLTNYLWKGMPLGWSFQLAKAKSMAEFYINYGSISDPGKPFIVSKSGWNDWGDYSESTGLYSHAARVKHDTKWDSPFYYARKAHDPNWGGDDHLYDSGTIFDNESLTFFYRKYLEDENTPNNGGNNFNTNGAYLMLTGDVVNAYQNEFLGWWEYGQGPTNSYGTLKVTVKYWNDQYYTTIISIEEEIENHAVNRLYSSGEESYQDYAYGSADGLYLFISADTMELLDDGVDRKLRIELEFMDSGPRESMKDPNAEDLGGLYYLETIELLEIGSYYYLL